MFMIITFTENVMNSSEGIALVVNVNECKECAHRVRFDFSQRIPENQSKLAVCENMGQQPKVSANA